MDIESIKDIIDKPSFQKFCNETIISKQKIDHLVIGYHPFSKDIKREEVEGAYLIIVDDVLYYIDCVSYYKEKSPYYEHNFIVVNNEAKYCNDYIIDSDLKLLKFAYIDEKIIEVAITQEQIDKILLYKESYRKKMELSGLFQNILNQQDINEPKITTNIGFIVNSEDYHSVLPYHCYMILNDEDVYIINAYFNESSHDIEVDISKISISNLLSSSVNINKTIELKKYWQHENKVFKLSEEQLTMILKHQQSLLDIAEEERKRVELLTEETRNKEELAKKEKIKLIQSINECGLELSKGSITKDILINFIIRHTNDYFLDLQNHSFIEVTDSVKISQNVNENLNKSLNMLETLFNRRGYFENIIAKEYSHSVIIMALQYTSIEYYSKQFQLKFYKLVENIDKLTLTESLHQFIEISNIEYTNIEYNSFVHFLIDKQKITYDSNLNNKLITIKSMINELVEERELALFEASLLESSISPITMEEIDMMDGKDFESFIAKLFSKMGFKTKVTKGSHDQGIDIIASNLIESIGIQVKRYNLESTVSNKAIQEVFGGLNFYNLQKGMVVTSSFFTNSAKELAHSNNIILWDRLDLEKYLKMYY